MALDRYLVFRGKSFYAKGGWLDFLGSAEVLEDAVAMAFDGFDREVGWWHIADAAAGGALVAGVDGDYCGEMSKHIARNAAAKR